MKKLIMVLILLASFNSQASWYPDSESLLTSSYNPFDLCKYIHSQIEEEIKKMKERGEFEELREEELENREELEIVFSPYLSDCPQVTVNADGVSDSKNE